MAAPLNFIVGIACDNFVLMAADKCDFADGAVTLTQNQDKGFRLGEKTHMFCSGSPGDVANFGGLAVSSLQQNKFRFGYELKPKAAHHFLQKTVADNLRSGNAWKVDAVIGGFNEVENKAFLGTIDQYGAGVAEQSYVFQGFSGRFCYSIMDELYRKDMNEEQAMEVLQKCLSQAKTRFVASLPNFSVVKIDRSGVKQVADVDV
ncbi:hypothetical protein L596_026252 [Steinernema carpocapsae]|uniref:Proteasome subunit beta n=1 Tax=Steinernema carpocapsae TaxID=34508 RepID=A0A4V6XVP3_STECR|nr:hypothetical protein L596_026252 [Steinernema carpocapsae]